MAKMGRPPKGTMPKNVSLQLRISKEDAEILQECAKIMNISRTEVIEKGIRMVHDEVVKK